MGKIITATELYADAEFLPPSMFLRNGVDIWFIGLATNVLNVRTGEAKTFSGAFGGSSLEILTHEEVNEILEKESCP